MDLNILSGLGYKRLDSAKQNKTVSSSYISSPAQISSLKTDSVSFGAAKKVQATHSETMSKDTLQIYNKVKGILDETAKQKEQTLIDTLLKSLNLSGVFGVKINPTALISVDYSLKRNNPDSSASLTRLTEDKKYDSKLTVTDSNNKNKEILFSKNKIYIAGEQMQAGELNKIVKSELLKLYVEYKRVTTLEIINKLKNAYNSFYDSEFKDKPWFLQKGWFNSGRECQRYTNGYEYPAGNLMHHYSRHNEDDYKIWNLDENGNKLSYYLAHDNPYRLEFYICGYKNEKPPGCDLRVNFGREFEIVDGTFNYNDSEYRIRGYEENAFKKSLIGNVPDYDKAQVELKGNNHIKLTKNSVTTEIMFDGNDNISEYYIIDKDGKKTKYSLNDLCTVASVQDGTTETVYRPDGTISEIIEVDPTKVFENRPMSFTTKFRPNGTMEYKEFYEQLPEVFKYFPELNYDGKGRYHSTHALHYAKDGKTVTAYSYLSNQGSVTYTVEQIEKLKQDYIAEQKKIELKKQEQERLKQERLEKKSTSDKSAQKPKTKRTSKTSSKE